jgi:hypothetical protein
MRSLQLEAASLAFSVEGERYPRHNAKPIES